MAVLRSLRLAALAAALVGLAAGCGSEDPVVGGATTAPTTPTTAASTTTAAPRARFVLAGDSMMYDVAPAVQAALDPSAAEVVPLVVPSLFSPTVEASLDDAVRTEPTDAVVVMVGVWETGYETSTGLEVVQPGWGDGYRTEVLVPFADRMASYGTHLVLLAHPPMRTPDEEGRFAAVYEQWARLAAERPDTVTFARSGPWLGAGDYVEVVELPDGSRTRLRRTDGVHLCAEGAIRIASGLVDLLADVVGEPWAPVLVDSWETGAWTERFPADECPPEAVG